MLTRRELADAIDEVEQQIADLTEARNGLYTAHRDDLLAIMDKADVLVEMRAIKAAIAKRRKLNSAKADAVRELDAVTDEILTEIMSSHVREATNTAPDLCPLRPATGGQGKDADAASPDGGGCVNSGQASEAGQEAGGAFNGVLPPAPQRTPLMEAAE
jgi:hypothetical protein